MKIRNSGGAGKAWRTSFLGAVPNTTSWPSVALALSQGTFDRLITTNETVASASLSDAHVQSVLEDHQTFSFYVPLLGGGFWQGPAPDLQGLLTEVSAATIVDHRAHTSSAQVAAREKLVQHGVVFTVPDAAGIDAARNRMLAVREGLVKQWRMTPEIAAQALAEGVDQ
jgi:TRAP-type C4-dicarboxylate transport system substrate-binding protein